MFFGDYIDFWYQNFRKPTVHPLTQQNYENRIYYHIIPEIGNIPLNKLSQNDLQQFYARLKKNGRRIRVEQYGLELSDRMVRACHASCRSALEKAVEDGLIRVNPAIGCKLPPKKAHEMQAAVNIDRKIGGTHAQMPESKYKCAHKRNVRANRASSRARPEKDSQVWRRMHVSNKRSP